MGAIIKVSAWRGSCASASVPLAGGRRRHHPAEDVGIIALPLATRLNDSDNQRPKLRTDMRKFEITALVGDYLKFWCDRVVVAAE